MAVPQPPGPHVGSVLGQRYELVSHLARGGMGDVYEALDLVLQRRVAVKLYRAASPHDRSRFDAEVRVLAGLTHPGLVRVYDAGAEGDDAYVVLELIDGPDLATCLREQGPMSSHAVAQLGSELADALAYIHANGVVHRDVTLTNVLCDPDGHPRLVDFGIVRLLDSPRVTATATTIGTAAFMAPEQVRGDDVTPAADVYALGLVLLEALTGRRAFTGTLQEVALARLHRDPDTSSGVPGAWQGVLARMTAGDPGARPSAEEVRSRLTALAAPDPTTAPVVVPTARTEDLTGETTGIIAAGPHTTVLPFVPLDEDEPLPPVERRRRRALWVMGAGMAAALALVIGLAAANGPSPATTPPASTTSSAPATTVAQRARVTTTVPTTTTLPPTTTSLEPTTTSLVIPPPDVPFGQAKKEKGPGPGSG